MSAQPLRQAVAYYRVSTERQGRSGLGLEAQREAVNRYLASGGWTLLHEVQEQESGGNNDRPMLTDALRLCARTGATLVIARLDRLSRNASFLLHLRDGHIPFVAVDIPDASTLTIGILACVAQAERERVVANTVAALAAAKARGIRLGNPNGFVAGARKCAAAAVVVRVAAADAHAARMRPVIGQLRDAGLSLDAIADRLTQDGVQTARGGSWTATTVRNVLLRKTAIADK